MQGNHYLYTVKSLKFLNKYFFKNKFRIGLGIVFIIAANVFQVYIPLQLRGGIDTIVETQNYDDLLYYVIAIIIAAIFSGIFTFSKRLTVIVASREIEYDLRKDFWKKIQQLSLRYFQNNSTGNIMAHATNDISAVRMYVGPAVMYSVDTITKFILVISIMISISTSLTIYTLLPLPIISFAMYQLSKRIHKKFTKIQEKFSELTTKAQENFSGIRVIKSYVREKKEIEMFTSLSKDYLERNMDKVRIQALFMPILFLITGVSIIIVIWYGGGLVISGVLTLGDLSAFIMYLGLLIWPMIAFGWVLNIIQQASASMKRLLKIFNEEIEIKDSPNADFNIDNIEGEVEFRNVSFKYKSDLPNVLKNLSFKIPVGNRIAIIGHTGVGKSSLVNLIPRLYDVTEGAILIDGKDVKEIPLDILRKNIGVVPQETFLFSDTLQNNIFYGATDVKEDAVREAARISGLDTDVSEFPDKYETVLGERGITLSGGQKQRAALARAIASNPKILILDDSFSAVDTKTEERILNNLTDFMKGRTSIIISHRISTVKDSDKILVLSNGEIAEEGTHKELIALNGIYADLNQKQLLEKELEEIN